LSSVCGNPDRLRLLLWPPGHINRHVPAQGGENDEPAFEAEAAEEAGQHLRDARLAAAHDARSRRLRQPALPEDVAGAIDDLGVGQPRLGREMPDGNLARRRSIKPPVAR